MLDLWQQEQADGDARVMATTAPRLPATFDETFGASWREGQLFAQSTAAQNARMEALEDYRQELRGKTGYDIAGDIDFGSDPALWPMQGQAAVKRLRDKNPEADIPDLNEDELDRRAVEKSRTARTDYQDISAREKTFGGKVGSFLGSTAAGATDPVNLIGATLAAPEGLGILGTALTWSAIAGGSQAAIEAVGAPYREQVQPGYLASGEPFRNVLGAAAFGGALGGGTKALGAAWTRVATGQWPRSIRDAGNVVAGEANIANTNVMPGIEGEVAHREALGKAIDDVIAGRTVDVDDIFARSRALIGRLETESGMTLPVVDQRVIAQMSEEAGLRERDAELADRLQLMDLAQTRAMGVPPNMSAAAEQLARVQTIERQLQAATGEERRALLQRRDELLASTTPERLQAVAAPIEMRRQVEAERASIADRIKAITDERARTQTGPLGAPMIGQRMMVRTGSLFDAYQARIEAVLAEASAAARETSAARVARAATGEKAPELPFVPSAAEARAEGHVGRVADGVQEIARRAGHDMPREEAQSVASAVTAAKTDEHARAILNEVAARPRTVADHPPPPMPAEPRETAATAPLAPADMAKTLASPEHAAATEVDLDRVRAFGDRQVAVDTDAKGEPIFKSLDSLIDEAKADQEAADQLVACSSPEPGEAAA